jgi:hypothetical protein
MLVNDAAGALAGLDEKELHRQLAGRVNTVLKAFHEDMEKVWERHSRTLGKLNDLLAICWQSGFTQSPVEALLERL